MGKIKSLASQTAIYGLSSILARMINWGLTPIYTKYFDTHDYGILSDLYSFTTYFLVILTFGMETAFFRFSRDKKESNAYSQSFFFVFLMAFVFVVAIVLGHNKIAVALGYPPGTHLVLLTALVLFFDALSALPMAKLRYENMAKKFATISIINIFISIVLNIYFIAYLHWGIEYVFIANLVASLVKFLLVSYKNFPTKLNLDLKLLKEMLKYSVYIMLAGFMGMLIENLDKNLLSRLWDTKVFNGSTKTGFDMVGIYAANYKLAIFIMLVVQSFRYAAEPFFFKQSNEKDYVLFARVFHYFLLVCLFFFLVISIFAYEIASFDIFGLLPFTFIDKNYWEGLPVVPILLFSYVLLAAQIQLSIWYKLVKKTRAGLVIFTVGGVLTIVLNIISIPQYGYFGCAVATVISYLVMCILTYYWGQKHFPIPYKIHRIILYTIVIIGAILLTLSFSDFSGHMRIVMKIIVIAFTLLILFLIEKFMPLKWKASDTPTV